MVAEHLEAEPSDPFSWADDEHKGMGTTLEALAVKDKWFMPMLEIRSLAHSSGRIPAVTVIILL